jgi:hypothetical protein
MPALGDLMALVVQPDRTLTFEQVDELMRFGIGAGVNFMVGVKRMQPSDDILRTCQLVIRNLREFTTARKFRVRNFVAIDVSAATVLSLKVRVIESAPSMTR